MPTFRYEAVTPAGQLRRGVIDADGSRGARTLLRSRGMTPIDVSAVAERTAGTSLNGDRKSVV